MSFLNTLIPTFTRTNGEHDTARRPRYEVTETRPAMPSPAYLPGVTKEGLEITDEGGELRITGRRTDKLPEGQTALYRETSDASYELVLVHDNSIDAEKIAAELRDGVLRLTLVKSESAKPRKVTVN